MSKFTDLLASPYARRRYLVIAKPYHAGAVTTCHWSDDGFNSAPTDDPANTHFEARIAKGFAFQVSRTMFAEGTLGGRSVPGYGVLRLANDGGLDWLADAAWDGRSVRIYLGGDDFAFADFGLIFDGTADGCDVGLDAVEIRLRDPQYKLDKPLLPNTYAGTGGWAGTPELANTRIPRAYGPCNNIEPVIVDPVNLRYQAHDGPVHAFDAVKDAGVALTIHSDYATTLLLDAAILAATVPAGQVGTCKAAGLFRLASPPAGLVTCDLRGDAAGGYVASAADVARRIVTTTGGLAPADLDAAAFAALAAAAPHPVQLYDREGLTIADALDQLLGAVGGWWGFGRTGLMDVGQVQIPVGPAAASFGPAEVLAIERLAARRPAWRLNLGYGRNWRPLSLAELAAQFLPGGSSAAAAPALTQEWLYVTAADAAVLVRHLLAQDLEETTLLADAAGAELERDRRFALDRLDLVFVRLQVKCQPFALDLGRFVEIRDHRFGLGAGKLFAVVGFDDDAAASEVEMTLMGVS